MAAHAFGQTRSQILNLLLGKREAQYGKRRKVVVFAMSDHELLVNDVLKALDGPPLGSRTVTTQRSGVIPISVFPYHDLDIVAMAESGGRHPARRRLEQWIITESTPESFQSGENSRHVESPDRCDLAAEPDAMIWICNTADSDCLIESAEEFAYHLRTQVQGKQLWKLPSDRPILVLSADHPLPNRQYTPGLPIEKLRKSLRLGYLEEWPWYWHHMLNVSQAEVQRGVEWLRIEMQKPRGPLPNEFSRQATSKDQKMPEMSEKHVA